MDSERLADVAAGPIGAAIRTAAANVARAHAGRPLEALTSVVIVLRPDGTGRLAVLVDGDVVDDIEVLLEYIRRVLGHDEVRYLDSPEPHELAVINRLSNAAGRSPVEPGHGEPRRVAEGLDAPARPDASLVDDDSRLLLDHDAMDDRAL